MGNNWKAGLLYLVWVAFVLFWIVKPMNDKIEERLDVVDVFESNCMFKEGVIAELDGERVCIKGRKIVLREVIP